MSSVEEWLRGRTPASPPELLDRLRTELERSEDASGLVETLAHAAEACTRRALSRPGRVRNSAYELLAADALMTYACEVALGSDDPEPALEALIRRNAAS